MENADPSRSSSEAAYRVAAWTRVSAAFGRPPGLLSSSSSRSAEATSWFNGEVAPGLLERVCCGRFLRCWRIRVESVRAALCCHRGRPSSPVSLDRPGCARHHHCEARRPVARRVRHRRRAARLVQRAPADARRPMLRRDVLLDQTWDRAYDDKVNAVGPDASRGRRCRRNRHGRARFGAVQMVNNQRQAVRYRGSSILWWHSKDMPAGSRRRCRPRACHAVDRIPAAGW